MKTIRQLSALCAAALLLPSLSTSAQEGKEYTIKLDRPDKAGDKSREEMKATIERSQRLTRGDEKLKDEASDMQVALTGVLEVVEVSEKGNMRKLTFTVEKSSLQEETGAAKELFKPGTVITGISGTDDKDKFEVEGKPVTGSAAEALNELFSLSGNDKKQIDEDAVFGTTKPRAAGSEWAVEPKKFIESMPEDLPFTLEEDGVKGTVKFPAVKQANGVECCQLQVSVTMKPATFKGMPRGFKLAKASFKVSTESLAPVDATLPLAEEKMDQRMEFSGEIPAPDGAMTLEIFRRTVKERKSAPVKP